jgi:hypothetical protein
MLVLVSVPEKSKKDGAAAAGDDAASRRIELLQRR